MSNQFSNIFGNIEELISKASKTNQEIVNETTKFISNFDTSNLNREYIGNLQRGLFSEAVNKITELNINYTTQLMGIGLDLARKLNENQQSANTPGSDTGSSEPSTPSSVSAFTIKTSGPVGGMASTAFLLNSDKEEPILCKVQNTPYTREGDATDIHDFQTTYTPQLFELKKGIAQRVDATIKVPDNVKTGVYFSKITVAGFEHTHFDLVLEVTPQEQMVQESEVKAATTVARTSTHTGMHPLSDHTVVELKEMAKDMGLSGYSTLNKADLIKFIEKAMHNQK